MNTWQYITYAFRYRCNPFHVAYLNGRHILDIGCGEGNFLRREPNSRIGVDIDPALVERCRSKGLESYCMSATKLDFPDATFDAIHAAELIEHFDPTTAIRFLSEAARVLRPGSIIYLTTPGENYIWNTFSHIRPYPPMAFKKLLGHTTEGYLRNGHLPLCLEKCWAFRRMGSGSL